MMDETNSFDGKTLNETGFAYLNLLKQDRWESFTVVFGSLTIVGAPSYTGRYRTVGKVCEFQVKFSAATSIASIAGTDYLSLPMTAQGIAGFGVMTDLTANTSVGVCHLDVTNSRLWLPTQNASAHIFTLYGKFEV